MSQNVHHKPAAPAPVTTSPPYIVLDDLVRKAVQKEWLELDYGAQWWSNDHAPTIYANSKLIPSLSTFLNNRWAELKPILEKRPVATKKIRLIKSKEPEAVPTAVPPAPSTVVLPSSTTLHPVQETIHRTVTSERTHSSNTTHQHLFGQEIPDFYTLLPSPTDIKPVDLPPPAALAHPSHQQTIPSPPVCIQPKHGLSMPRLSDSPPVDSHQIHHKRVENLSEKNSRLSTLLTSNNSINSKTTASEVNVSKLIDEVLLSCKQSFQQNKKDCDRTVIKPENDSLKMKIINLNKLKISHKNKKEGSGLNKEKEAKSRAKTSKKEKSSQSADGPKKKSRTLKVKYVGVKLKQCYVLMEKLSDEALMKYTGRTSKDMVTVPSNNSRLIPNNVLESKGGRRIQLYKVRHRGPRGPASHKASPVKQSPVPVSSQHPTSSSVKPLSTNNSNTGTIVVPVPTPLNTSPVKSADSLRSASLNDVTIISLTKVNPSANILPFKCDSVNNADEKTESQNSPSHNVVVTPLKNDNIKSTNLSVAEKLELLKAESLSVTAVSSRSSTTSPANNNTPNEVISNAEISKSTEAATNSLQASVPDLEAIDTGAVGKDITNGDGIKTVIKCETPSEMVECTVVIKTEIEPSNQETVEKNIETETTISIESPTKNLLNGDISKSLNETSHNKDKQENCSKSNGTIINDSVKREKIFTPPPPLKPIKTNTDYVNGKIIPLGQKGHSVLVKRRSSEDLPIISGTVSLSVVDKVKVSPTIDRESLNNKDDFLEKTVVPLINSNKGNESNNNGQNQELDSTTHAIDVNMNYTNKLTQKPLINNTTTTKNIKLNKEINATVINKELPVRSDSSDSNKENTFIEQPYDENGGAVDTGGVVDRDDITNKRNNRLDEEQPPLKKICLENRTEECVMNITNFRIDVNRMKFEEETTAVNGKQPQQVRQVEAVKRKIRPVERPMELPSTSFDNYSCVKCEGIFVHYKDWKMHYDSGHPKCAKVAAPHS